MCVWCVALCHLMLTKPLGSEPRCLIEQELKFRVEGLHLLGQDKLARIRQVMHAGARWLARPAGRRVACILWTGANHDDAVILSVPLQLSRFDVAPQPAEAVNTSAAEPRIPVTSFFMPTYPFLFRGLRPCSFRTEAAFRPGP